MLGCRGPPQSTPLQDLRPQEGMSANLGQSSPLEFLRKVNLGGSSLEQRGTERRQVRMAAGQVEPQPPGMANDESGKGQQTEA